MLKSAENTDGFSVLDKESQPLCLNLQKKDVYVIPPRLKRRLPARATEESFLFKKIG